MLKYVLYVKLSEQKKVLVKVITVPGERDRERISSHLPITQATINQKDETFDDMYAANKALFQGKTKKKK